MSLVARSYCSNLIAFERLTQQRDNRPAVIDHLFYHVLLNLFKPLNRQLQRRFTLRILNGGISFILQ